MLITETHRPHKTNINLIDIKIRVVNPARIRVSLTSRKSSTFNCEVVGSTIKNHVYVKAWFL